MLNYVHRYQVIVGSKFYFINLIEIFLFQYHTVLININLQDSLKEGNEMPLILSIKDFYARIIDSIYFA